MSTEDDLNRIRDAFAGLDPDEASKAIEAIEALLSELDHGGGATSALEAFALGYRTAETVMCTAK